MSDKNQKKDTQESTKETKAEDTTKTEETEVEDTTKIEEKNTKTKTAKTEENKTKEETKETVKLAPVPEKFKKIVKEIENMSVIELNELVKVFEEKFGVSAQATAVASAGGAGGDTGADVQNLFAVELTQAGGQKIAVIKVVKSLLGLGLKEAKDAVDGAPTVLKEGVKKEEAEDIKKQIEGAGGTVTLK